MESTPSKNRCCENGSVRVRRTGCPGLHLPWSLIFCPTSLTFCPTLVAASLPRSAALSVRSLALLAASSILSLILSLVSAMSLLLTRHTGEFRHAGLIQPLLRRNGC